MRKVTCVSSLVRNFRCLTVRGLHTQSLSSGVGSPIIPARLEGSLKSQLEPKKESPCHKDIGQLPFYFKYHTISEFNCLSGLNEPIEKIDKINTNLIYECPKINNEKVIEAPPIFDIAVPLETPPLQHKVIEQPGTTSEKLANSELRRRMRSMKKRQWRRRKAKMWPELRKMRFLRKLSKQKKMDRYAKKFETLGNEFDALEYIKKNLATAKEKGFHINIFRSK